MGFSSIIASGVKTANKLTDSLQVRLTRDPWVSSDYKGDPTYGTPDTINCIVDYTLRQIADKNGQQQVITATLTIVGDLAPIGTAGRREPIDPRDRIWLPDGSTGPIVESPSGSTVNPDTGRGFIQTVMIGSR